MKLLHQQRPRKHNAGFSLVELLVAMAITIIVLTAALLVFVKSMDTNDMTTQITDMQANARSGANALAEDLGQSGTGLPWGGVVLPSQGGAAQEVFGADNTGTVYLNPNSYYSDPTGNRVMYGVTPAPDSGPSIGGTVMDSINMVYSDPILSSTNPAVSNWPTTPAANVVTAGSTTTITMPAGMLPAINDANSGIQVGDVLMLTANGSQAIATVTGVNPGANQITVGPGDPLAMNQSGAGMSGTIPDLGALAGMSVMRLRVVTYFLQGLNAAGAPLAPPAAAAVDYRLMRQVDAQQPAIVAEHVDYLQFSYDLADANCAPTTKLSHIFNALEPACGTSPAAPAYDKIRTVYVNLAARTEKPDKRGTYYHTTVNTSIGPRSLSYHNTYP